MIIYHHSRSYRHRCRNYHHHQALHGITAASYSGLRADVADDVALVDRTAKSSNLQRCPSALSLVGVCVVSSASVNSLWQDHVNIMYDPVY